MSATGLDDPLRVGVAVAAIPTAVGKAVGRDIALEAGVGEEVGRGLGGVLTDYCLEVAKKWGVTKVVAEVSKENTRMLATFRNRGFALNDEQEQDVVLVSKPVE